MDNLIPISYQSVDGSVTTNDVPSSPRVNDYILLDRVAVAKANKSGYSDIVEAIIAATVFKYRLREIEKSSSVCESVAWCTVGLIVWFCFINWIVDNSIMVSDSVQTEGLKQTLFGISLASIIVYSILTLMLLYASLMFFRKFISTHQADFYRIRYNRARSNISKFYLIHPIVLGHKEDGTEVTSLTELPEISNHLSRKVNDSQRVVALVYNRFNQGRAKKAISFIKALVKESEYNYLKNHVCVVKMLKDPDFSAILEKIILQTF